MVSAMSLPWFVYASNIVAYWLTSAWHSVVQPLPWEHGVQTNVTHVARPWQTSQASENPDFGNGVVCKKTETV